MARPVKKGLDYYPKDVDYYDDNKIIELLDKYGPAGATVFDVLLSSVYREGYYWDAPIDDIARKIVRAIGNRWVKKDFVLQVIDYCAEIGLLHDGLLHQGIITSAGIQRRYATITGRSKANRELYWLLEAQQPRESDAEKPVSATKTRVNAAKTQVNAEKMPQRKENYSSSNLTGNAHMQNPGVDNFEPLTFHAQSIMDAETRMDQMEERSRTAFDWCISASFQLWNRKAIPSEVTMCYMILEDFQKRRGGIVASAMRFKNGEKFAFKMTFEEYTLLPQAFYIAASAGIFRLDYVRGIFNQWLQKPEKELQYVLQTAGGTFAPQDGSDIGDYLQYCKEQKI